MSFRSVLFNPASRPDRFAKALASGADCVALDLEDGTGAQDRPRARKNLEQFLAECPAREVKRTAVRINPPSSPDGRLDLSSMSHWPVMPKLIMVPKVEDCGALSAAAAMVSERGCDTAVCAIVESPLGIENCWEILSGSGCGMAAFGPADYAAAIRVDMQSDLLSFARARLSNAAAAAGKDILDGPALDFRNLPELNRESRRARDLGFSGKIAIHPGQVSVINEVFSANDLDVSEAEEILAAAKNLGGGAFAFRGRMIDKPLLRQAERIVGMARTK